MPKPQTTDLPRTVSYPAQLVVAADLPDGSNIWVPLCTVGSDEQLRLMESLLGNSCWEWKVSENLPAEVATPAQKWYKDGEEQS